MTTEQQDIVSNSEHEDTDVEEEQTQIAQPQAIQGQILPDEHPQLIDADENLAEEYADDADYIELVHLKIRSLEALNLGRFPALKHLILRQNLLDSMGEVKRLPEDIEELDLYDNRIKHISQHLNDKVGLKNLDLSFNKIRNIKNIDKLVNLESLYFIENKISEIVGLETLTKLKSLELGGNRLTKIENLDTLVNLNDLWLGKNRIAKLENLDKLTKLKILSIQSNRITKLEGLDHLKNLEELYITHCGISKIEGLDKNLKLTTLDITGNRIRHMENVSHLKNLTDLWASYNLFDSYDEVERELKDLPELDTIYLEGTPLQVRNKTAYRRKLIMFLPQVNKIDATYVR